ncbi:unnamed protein product [Didymodactylos carnosus]|uniref:CCHC-type domain-containing protein n=2 Tax=Didymodactylos carnosus TaxID=1234261 RepID=A0A8S2I4C0_9BILA|nr:unnamed protein product [Didymodactylos carnosus]CAF3695711.1 unnamed protein product [Didymodactylos carnosus]
MVDLRGRKRTCFRCGADDHLKRDCSAVKCASCRQFGHENCNQSPSYANTVKSRKEYPNSRGQRAVTNTRSSVSTEHPDTLVILSCDNNGMVPLPVHVQQDADGFQGGNAVHENNTTLVAAENIEMEEITNVHVLSDTGSETDEVFESVSQGSKHDPNSPHVSEHPTLSEQQQDEIRIMQEHNMTMSYYQQGYGNFKRSLDESNLVTVKKQSTGKKNHWSSDVEEEQPPSV